MPYHTIATLFHFLAPPQGDFPPGCKHGVGADVIFAERRGQSQKPEEIYELIEELVPNGRAAAGTGVLPSAHTLITLLVLFCRCTGRYLEIFARRNNLRDYWVSIGNEL